MHTSVQDIFKESSLRKEIEKYAQQAEFPPDTVLLKTGQYVKLLPIVLQGTIKVVREDEAGNELLLYYIKPGESCAMSFSAYMNDRTSEVKALTTKNTEVLLIPAQYIQEWMRLYPSWQAFALQLYNQRFEELLGTIEDIAFRKMDERLIKYLEQKAKVLGKNELSNTHQEIANDLGTSREVISRLLKQLEKRGNIQLSRNSLKIFGFM